MKKEDYNRIQIEDLPWISYATKKAARPGDAAWIFVQKDEKGDLVKAIRESPSQRLELDPYVFTFSGNQNQFISRRPLKKGRS